MTDLELDVVKSPKIKSSFTFGLPIYAFHISVSNLLTQLFHEISLHNLSDPEHS